MESGRTAKLEGPGELREEYAKEARRAFVTAIASLIMSPLLLVLGFWINNYLQAPKFSVVYVDASCYVENASLSKTALDEAKKNRRVMSTVRSYLPYSDLAWLDGESVAQETAERINQFIVTSMTNMNYQIGMVERTLTELKQWDQSSPLWLRNFPPYSFPTSQDEIKKSAPRIISDLTSSIAEYKEDLTVFENLQKAIAEVTKNKGTRTGACEIKVGVLNGGNSDGVVFAEAAELQFEGTTLPLKSENYSVVKAHSFTEVRFKVNEGKALPEILSRWKDHITKGAQQRYAVVLQTGTKRISGEDVLDPIAKP